MAWLQPSIIAVLTGTVVLAATYSYLAASERYSYLKKWAIGWWIYALRFVFTLFSLSYPQAVGLNIGVQLCALLSGFFLMWGTYEFVKRPMPEIWVFIASATGLWIIVGSLWQAPFLSLTIPTFGFLGIVYIATGIALVRTSTESQEPSLITGITFVLWGLHKINYPFLRPLEWFAPWGYLLGAVFELLAAQGIILIHFQQTKKALKRTLEELKRRDRMLNKSQEIARLGSWHFDLEKNVLKWSDEVYRILGHQHGEFEATYDAFLNAIHPDDRDMVDKTYWTAVQTNTPYECIHRIVRTDGTVRTVLEKSEDVVDATGKATDSYGYIHDITERVVAEEERRQMEEKLHRAHKLEAVGTLAGGIAHDFNNVLGAVSGFLELAIEEEEIGPSTRQYLLNAQMAVDRATLLVRQILAFSKRSGTKKEVVDPVEIVREALSMVRSSIPAKIETIEKVSEDIGTIEADSTQLYQAVVNLCINGAHAMPNGGTLTVSIQRNAEPPQGVVPNGDSDFIEIAVTDTGTGIEPDIVDKIFDPFFTTKKDGKGTGMGLSIVYGIAQEYGGGVTVESRVDEGSTFRLFLPLNAHSANEPEPTRVQADRTHKTGRILLVDDEPMLRDLAVAMFGRMGYEIETLASGEEATARLADGPDDFDLLITDYSMPGMSGLDLARNAKERCPALPVILCTGYGADLEEATLREAGIHKIVFKPLKRENLVHLLDEVLSKNGDILVSPDRAYPRERNPLKDI